MAHQQVYAYVTGVTIDEVDEDIGAVACAVESQVEQKWIADVGCSVTAWPRRADWTDSHRRVFVPHGHGALNANIDAQTVDAWAMAVAMSEGCP